MDGGAGGPVGFVIGFDFQSIVMLVHIFELDKLRVRVFDAEFVFIVCTSRRVVTWFVILTVFRLIVTSIVVASVAVAVVVTSVVVVLFRFVVVTRHSEKLCTRNKADTGWMQKAHDRSKPFVVVSILDDSGIVNSR